MEQFNDFFAMLSKFNILNGIKGNAEYTLTYLYNFPGIIGSIKLSKN